MNYFAEDALCAIKNVVLCALATSISKGEVFLANKADALRLALTTAKKRAHYTLTIVVEKTISRTKTGSIAQKKERRTLQAGL